MSPWLTDFRDRLAHLAEGSEDHARQLDDFCDQVCRRLPDASNNYLRPFREHGEEAGLPREQLKSAEGERREDRDDR